MSNEISFIEFAPPPILIKEENTTTQEPNNIIGRRESDLEHLTAYLTATPQTTQLEQTGILGIPVQSYTKKEIFEEVVAYFEGDELAAGVWIDKYSLKNDKGELLERNPDEMHHRLAREFARIEKKYSNPLPEEKIYELFKKFQYIIPQGSPMAGIGNNYQVASLSNCFVIGNDQSSDSTVE